MSKIFSSNRSFGILLFVILLGLSIFFYGLTANNLFWASIIILGISIFYPNFFKVPNILWIKFGIILGKIINPIICIFLYFFVIGSTRIVLELFRKKLINKTKNSNLETYWVKKDNSIEQSLDNQF